MGIRIDHCEHYSAGTILEPPCSWPSNMTACMAYMRKYNSSLLCALRTPLLTGSGNYRSVMEWNATSEYPLHFRYAREMSLHT